MIYPELSNWIADSESWQAHKDYDVPDTNVRESPFFQRQADFYISLLSKLQDVLSDYLLQETQEIKDDLLLLAKGLEIYSLENKRTAFEGVNYRRNMLYVASLYYLADFPATTILLLRQFSDRDYPLPLEGFLYHFLSRTGGREQASRNSYFEYVFNFLKDGDARYLAELDASLLQVLAAEATEGREFVLAYFSRCVTRKFLSNNIWADLTPFGNRELWKPYVRFNLSKSPAIWSFFPSQQDAIIKGLMGFEKAFSLQTPTSSGKTSITELAIYHEIRLRPETKILYLAPFRALASELRRNLGWNLNRRFGIKIKTIYGGNVVSEWDRMNIREATVLISTPEKFIAVESSDPEVSRAFSLVICDEGHLIDSASRGISYELLLSRLKTNNPQVRFLFLSAIIPNIGAINEWLGGTADQITISNYRPTEIHLALLERIKPRIFNLDVNPGEDVPKRYTVANFLSEIDLAGQAGRLTPKSNKALVAAAALKSLNSGAVAIFNPTKDRRRGVAGTALQIIESLRFGLPNPLKFANATALAELDDYCGVVFGSSFLLCVCIRNGFLFHHGDLPQFVRELIEAYVRDEKVKLLVCTNTLSEGVNLPIKTLVVQGTTRFNGKYSVPIQRRDLKNLIGRAGRAGKETKGTIIITNVGDFERLDQVINNQGLEDAEGFLAHALEVIDRYVLENGAALTNDLLDQLREADIIDEAILKLLAEDIDAEKLADDIKELTRSTFTYFQSDAQRKARLEEIFSLRSERVRDALDTDVVRQVRATGIPLRVFHQYAELLDFSAGIFESLSASDDPEWLEYLIDSIFGIHAIDPFLPEDYDRGQFVAFVGSWLNGYWFDQLGDIVGKDVEEVLELIRFVDYEFLNVAERIIKYVILRRNEENLDTSRVVADWTKYLSYGVSNLLELALVEIGLSERIVIRPLSIWLMERGFYETDKESLKSILIRNAPDIFSALSYEIPAIAGRNLLEFLNSIGD